MLYYALHHLHNVLYFTLVHYSCKAHFTLVKYALQCLTCFTMLNTCKALKNQVIWFQKELIGYKMIKFGQMVLKVVSWVHNAKFRSYGLKRSQMGTQKLISKADDISELKSAFKCFTSVKHCKEL